MATIFSAFFLPPPYVSLFCCGERLIGKNVPQKKRCIIIATIKLSQAERHKIVLPFPLLIQTSKRCFSLLSRFDCPISTSVSWQFLFAVLCLLIVHIFHYPPAVYFHRIFFCYFCYCTELKNILHRSKIPKVTEQFFKCQWYFQYL